MSYRKKNYTNKMSARLVNVNDPQQQFVLRSVKTKGLRPNTFNGERTKGFQITLQVPDDEVGRIQDAWESHEPKYSTPFFGDNMLTVKARKLSDKMKKECLASTERIMVDIMFGITDIYVDEQGDKFPQLRLSGL